jgi:hypothetical protein
VEEGRAERTEAAQEHLLDPCRLLGHPTHAEADATGAGFCFEKGAANYGGGGFALVWKRNFFGGSTKESERA